MKSTTYSKIAFRHYVRCISIRLMQPKQITVGQNYIMDLSSLYIDSDGEAYAEFYTTDGQNIGTIALKHFESI